MNGKQKSVLGYHAPTTRMTPLAAFLVALAFGVPAGLALWIAEIIWM